MHFVVNVPTTIFSYFNICMRLLQLFLEIAFNIYSDFTDTAVDSD